MVAPTSVKINLLKNSNKWKVPSKWKVPRKWKVLSKWMKWLVRLSISGEVLAIQSWEGVILKIHLSHHKVFKDEK